MSIESRIGKLEQTSSAAGAFGCAQCIRYGDHFSLVSEGYTKEQIMRAAEEHALTDPHVVDAEARQR